MTDGGASAADAVELDVVIVTWNAGDHLMRCLDALARSAGDRPTVRITVVDNASSDGSVPEALPDGVHGQVIRNPHNRGFAAACNQGAKAGTAPFLLFLNPDMVVNAESLRAPLELLISRGDVGICGVQLRQPSGEIARSCARFPTPANLWATMLGLDRMSGGRVKGMHMHEWDHASSAAVDEVIGAYLLIRRELFERLHGFDERFFVYFEEVDLCYRAAALGERTYYFAGTHAIHAGRGTTEAIPALRYFYGVRSRVLYARKHFNRAAALGILAGSLIAEPIARSVVFAGKRQWRALAATWSGAWRLWRAIPSLLKT